jgi:predicted  nucleic acid-binding Zn-ribbon protein
MGVIKQLYQLQEIDLELESSEQALQQVTSQRGESQAVAEVQARLVLERQHLDELKRQQRSAEWEIEDLTGKLTTAEENLYSGRIKNPKELTNLEREVGGLRENRNQLEDKTLEIMDQVELATATVLTVENEFKALEAEWRRQQQQLSSETEHLKATISELKRRRQLLSASIDSKAVEIYNELRRQKGMAVARVKQGICGGCRISLSSSELQRARGGNLVQCSSCGRILFLD